MRTFRARASATVESPPDAMAQATIRIAMWSGPRNLSTALMRSFSSRPDTTVLDEPFYAHYLRETGIDHPGRDDVIAAYENDWRRVVDFITGPIPDGKPSGTRSTWPTTCCRTSTCSGWSPAGS